MAEYHYELFADFFQFYLVDEQSNSEWSERWTEEAVQNNLALADGVIVVGTARNVSVPVSVMLVESMPDDDLSVWDQVNECSVCIPSGCLVIAGCTDSFRDAERIPVIPGWYRARVYYGGLGTVSANRLEGQDHYHIILWPAPYRETLIIKK